jgi:glucose-6-phosphate isomerase
VYSKAYAGFNDLVTQLMHETLSKERKGLTALCFEGPEVQHHTNQRVLDGPEDVVTLFVTKEGDEGPAISWDGAEGDVMLGESYLNEVGGYALGKAFRSEYEGVMGHMRELKMPFARLVMKGEGPFEMGEYIGIWHYLAYYFALLRKVNPFDQPAVEKAKEIGMALRLKR